VKNVLADIVSSQLDADRLDYLRRDSHFCGVTYGQFDFRWMLHCMAIVNDKQHERLGITYKGIGVVEHYLMARRLMIRNIYYSQKKLALEFLLVQLLARVSEQLEDKNNEELCHTRLGLFLNRVNAFNQKVPALKDLTSEKKHFLKTCFPIYKELCDYDIFAFINRLAEGKDKSPVTQMATRLQYREIPKIIRLDFMNLAYLEALVAEFKNTQRHTIQEWQLALIKTPHQSYLADDDPILVVDEHQAVRPINEMSLMIHAISDKYEQTAFLCIDRALMGNKKVEALVKKLRAEAVVASA